jgi:F-type H+-transporting ATPase subunit epsilon
MAKTLQVSVVTPEGSALSVEATSVQAPGHLGYLGVLPGHAPMLCLLRPGVLTVKNEGAGETRVLAIRGGFLEVGPEAVTVLADEAVDAAEVDKAEVEKAFEAIVPLPDSFDGETLASRSVAREQAREERENLIDWCEARINAADRLGRG